jgi:hypothetical protein
MRNLDSYSRFVEKQKINEGVLDNVKKKLNVGSEAKFSNIIDKFKTRYAKNPEVLALLTKEKEAELKNEFKGASDSDVRILYFKSKNDIALKGIDRGSATSQGRKGGTAG